MILGGDINTSKNKIDGEFVTEKRVISGDIKTGAPPAYAGEYEITPSSEIQTIPIEGKVAKQDIIINPIPSNYGRITWDGTTLTVS